uniref:Uncharacterized protein n=1 Tax=Triticum urartu TaxID=4572 RepID=A0A8R7TZ81_TRIUA
MKTQHFSNLSFGSRLLLLRQAVISDRLHPHEKLNRADMKSSIVPSKPSNKVTNF